MDLDIINFGMGRTTDWDQKLTRIAIRTIRFIEFNNGYGIQFVFGELRKESTPENGQDDANETPNFKFTLHFLTRDSEIQSRIGSLVVILKWNESNSSSSLDFPYSLHM